MKRRATDHKNPSHTPIPNSGDIRILSRRPTCHRRKAVASEGIPFTLCHNTTHTREHTRELPLLAIYAAAP